MFKTFLENLIKTMLSQMYQFLFYMSLFVIDHFILFIFKITKADTKGLMVAARWECFLFLLYKLFSTNPIPKSWDTVQIVNKKECNNLQIS